MSALKKSLLPFVFSDAVILAMIWLVGAAIDRVWIGLDRSVPYWDQGAHLTIALQFLQAIQHANVFSSDWWTDLWRISSSYRSPFVYLATVPCLAIFGRGFEQALLVNLVFTGMLLGATYLLGKSLFNRQVGLWAAGLCLFPPIFAILRTDYLLDYGLTATVAVAFACLTCWRGAIATKQKGLRLWGWAIAWGCGLGITLLAKPTGLLFLFLPIAWMTIGSLARKRWGQLLQILVALLLAWCIFGGWFSTNWLTVLTSSDRSNSLWMAEGLNPDDPRSVWSYYLRQFPRMVSMPLLVVSLGCFCLALIVRVLKYFGVAKRLLLPSSPRAATEEENQNQNQPALHTQGVWRWLWIFLLGTYILLSLLHNKDPRHIMPILPVVLVVLARGITLWQTHWAIALRWGTLAVASCVLIVSLFPIPGADPLGNWISRRLPYMGTIWPQAQIISEVVKAEPYLQSTIGVIPNLADLNPMNVDFYGALADFQVYGRELGFSPENVLQDARSLSWYLSKSDDQGSVNYSAQAQKSLGQLVVESEDLEVRKTWKAPDGSQIRLHHRRLPFTIVEPLKEITPIAKLQLKSVKTPSVAIAGKPVQIAYEWIGNWEQLKNGLVLLTWQNEKTQTEKESNWTHDHAIGQGNLFERISQPDGTFRITENMAMLPPQEIKLGTYILKGKYLNRKTKESIPLEIPPIQIQIESGTPPQSTPPQSTQTPATPIEQAKNSQVNSPAIALPIFQTNFIPELDLITQLRQLGASMRLGKLDSVFKDISRINQYDPIQDYLNQAQLTIGDRANTEKLHPDLAYALGLAYVLQRKAPQAIAAFTQITQVTDPTNVWAWAYLGFVHLYSFQPQAAEAAFSKAAQLNPNIPELKTLRIVSAAMNFNISLAWERYQAERKPS
ncbi:hypothetical protein TUMEXPCC7403_05435 [Tumidithrix helvetica PCC 7403]|uniref:glycosyltransferase family 39 protein n=1 Tax=Tumidithrix helvetica TaxID=3457545 RepID=UPI003CB256CC